MKNFFVKLSIFCLIISAISCSNNDDNKKFTPKFKSIDVSQIAPTSMQQKSPEAYGVLSQMCSYMALPSGFMQNPNGKTGTTSGTWTNGDYTITYTYGDDGTQYNFSYVATNAGVEFFTITGWENMDGTAGAWDYTINTAAMGDPSGSNYNISFTWNETATGGYNFDLNFDFGGITMHYVVHTFDADSGEYFFYQDNVLNQECQWTATGGTYTDYTEEPDYVFTWTN